MLSHELVHNRVAMLGQVQYITKSLSFTMLILKEDYVLFQGFHFLQFL
jgi:hypothetical protein